MKGGWKLHAGAAALLSACAVTAPGREPLAAGSARSAASADLRDRAGRTVAQASATQLGDSVRLQIQAVALPPGSYGAHIHAVGRCDPADFTSAGPHWNPTGQQHGKNNPQGMHKGDLPNLMVGADRRGSLEITVPAASISDGSTPLLDVDGAAIVIHERADDYRTDPSGNSGARIACGVFGAAGS